jgi:peptidoglycan L-alanyl-D-glutamate endopeptidase CwlK
MFTLSQRSLKNREGVNPKLIEISDLALTISVIDFGHPSDSGLRIAKRQHQLFLAGKSECDGYEDESRHQSGDALDFYAYVNGAASWNTEHLAMVAAAFLQAASLLGYPLRWGGHFRPLKCHRGNDYKGGFDYPHVELVDEI